MDFDFKKVYRDVVWLGDCDQGCLVFVEFFGWKKELEDFVWREYVSIDVQLGVEVFNFSILVFFRKFLLFVKDEVRIIEREKLQ